MAERRLIYDVGANKGEDTQFYLAKGFSVVAIEAAPELCEQLRHKFVDYINAGHLKVLNIAISRSSGKIDFYIDTEVSVWNTTNLNWVSRNRSSNRIRKIVVDSAPLAEIIKEYGVPYYCKIDIEGNDLLALDSLRNCNIVPSFISIESEQISWGRLLEGFSTLCELGYRRYKVIDQELIHWQECPYPALEGEYLEHTFEKGASGLFGEELPGQWLQVTEAIEAYKNIFRGYALNGNYGLLASGGPLNFGERVYSKLCRLIGNRRFIKSAEILPSSGWYDTHAAL